MLRIVLFLVVVLLAGLGFAWLAEQSGGLTLTLGGYEYHVGLAVAAILVVVVFAAVMLLWWIVRSIWNTPSAVTRYFRTRWRDRGYKAISTGLIAAGAGDGGLARRMGKQASKLVSSDQEPLIHLLDAQAALLQDDHDAAQAKFTAMAQNPETRLLGLRGLYLEAERMGKREVARHYALEAAQSAPQLDWAVNAGLEAKTEEHDWQGALALVDSRKTSSDSDRKTRDRQRAVLLTAQAMDLLDGDPSAARSAALEANRLQPDFVPAAVVAAKALFRQNDLRRGSKVLEAIWKKEPHPEVAETYLYARAGDSTHDRLARAKKLRRLRPNNVESELAFARAALDASELKEARAAAEAAVRIAPREGAFLLLADIEEAETGDQGRVRHWLAKAVRAPRDPAWVADGYVSEHWAPASPVTGELDAFEWRTPVERLGQVIESEEALQALPAIDVEPEPEEKPAATEDSAAGFETPSEDVDMQGEEVQPPKASEAPKASTEPSVEENSIEEHKNAPPEHEEKISPTIPNGEGLPTEEAERKRWPVPDDPGVEDKREENPNGSGRFQLF
ncbi:heme biosynthesis protein HemY [Chelativorans sp. YIM 93263]|uniref:heme biosynthesis protein HemY n=1 Tax=Chelativorans sp. YIM 93263 TaxID=2906648 RepID=UPI0023782B9E|nr:heme biosynthesis HemY N-terminal domain-containing protein [Chelativorans sp. YIM 93263]